MTAFLLLLTGCLDFGTESARTDVSRLLDAHNQVRADAMPRPEPALEPLSWSAELAQGAQDWADACVFEHSEGTWGENLYASSESVLSPVVVSAWASEAADYDLESGDCDGQCGHYTQLVWRDTARVGCGAAWCDTLFSGGSGGELWVCRYDPPGNWIGERPY